MFDFTHPWYRPLSRRIGVVLACAVWFALELWMQAPFWIALSGAAAAYTLWKLILAFPPDQRD